MPPSIVLSSHTNDLYKFASPATESLKLDRRPEVAREGVVWVENLIKLTAGT